MADWAIGIDIGGTKIAGALISSAAEMADWRVLPTPRVGGGHSVLQVVTTLAVDLLHSPSLPAGAQLRGIGVGTGGQVEFGTGRILGATQAIPQWAGVDLKGTLERATGLPTAVDNDAKVMARAELSVGAAQGADTAIFITLGTGVGGALATSGRVLHGTRGLAGHLGHIRADEGEADPPLCSCGRRGCLEAYASGPAIRAAGLRALEQMGRSTPEATVANASSVWEAHRRGEGWATEVIGRARRALAHVLAGLVYTLNPDTIVIGGGLSSWGSAWCREIEDELRALVDQAFMERLKVVPAGLGNRAGTVGAGLLAFEAVGAFRSPRNAQSHTERSVSGCGT